MSEDTTTQSEPTHGAIHADDAESAIAALARAYEQRVSALDRPAVLELYADDAVVLDLMEGQSANGLGEWDEAVARWFGSLEPGQSNRAEIGELTVTGEGNLVLAHGTARYWVENGGESTNVMCNRLTWVARRGGDGAWRIIHEHTSAPISWETGKASLEG